MNDNSTNWDRGINHYLYTPSTNDLRFYEDPNKWSLSGPQAAQYVRGHLIKSLKDDHPEVLELYEQSGKHPFMLMRSMMPYLESVSTLYEPGKNDLDRVVFFVKKYFRVNYDTESVRTRFRRSKGVQSPHLHKPERWNSLFT